MFNAILTSLGPRCARRTLALTFLLVTLGVQPAIAQVDTVAAHDAAGATPFDGALSHVELAVVPAAPKLSQRGMTLTALEASFVGLQALDTVSTLRALDRGLVEGNPLMRSVTSRPAAFIAVKAGSTAGIVFLTRRLTRESRVSGIILLAALDSVYSFVVSRNFALAAAR